ncbi:MAG: GNAT family N-acetyltransferase [Sphingobium sp.]
MTIRALTADDRIVWQRLWREYQAFYKVSIASEVSDLTFKRLLDPVEMMHCAVVVLDNEPVGFVHFIYHRSTWTSGDYCYLQDLFVDIGERGRGHGRKLIEHVYEAATSAGASRVYWLTHETNTDAMLLYDHVAERSGFLQYRKNI